MPDTFKTSDLQLASFLVTLGYPVIAVEGPGNRRCFVFRDVPEGDVTAYYGGARQVRPRDLFGAYRDLKALLFQIA